MQQQTEWGELSVHDDVLAAIAGAAAIGTDGVAEMAQTRLAGNLTELLGRESSTRGVEISEDPDGIVAVVLHLVVRYGVNIPEVAGRVVKNVQTAVRQAVGETGLAISVHIEGVRKA